jgi:uncharacterized protein
VLVRDIVYHPGEMRETSLDVALTERWGEGLVAVPEGAVVAVDARLESVHEGILASVTASTTYEGVCGRCLADVSAPVEVEFQELFAYSGAEANDFEVQDDHVDLETPVRDTIVLALPFQPVCRPDCPGLDPITGEPRADDTDTTSGAALDPRWAALQELSGEPEAGSEPAPQTPSA